MNKNQYQITLLMFLSLALGACATIPLHRPKPVPAGFLYEGSYINIRAPDSHGWELLGSSSTGMMFSRLGTESGESYAAYVSMFPLEETMDSDEFVSFIRKQFEEDTDLVRFEIMESKFQYSEERGYPCVVVNYVTTDKKARTSLIRREVLLLQAESLYCRHPVRQETGFAIIYSYRGRAIYSTLSAEAQDFIRGVQVPAQRDN